MQATVSLPARRVNPAAFLAIATVLALIGVGIAALALSGSPASTVTVGPERTGSTVELAHNGTLIVELPANPSTGYSWVVTSIEGSVLARLGEPEFAPESDLLGAGGLMTFRFEAVGSGEGAVRLDYQRSWEDGPALDTFTVTVDVH